MFTQFITTGTAGTIRNESTTSDLTVAPNITYRNSKNSFNFDFYAGATLTANERYLFHYSVIILMCVPKKIHINYL
jgi:hypothetical protein